MIIIANIRYADEPSELIPLTKMNIKFVKRYGDTKIGYYSLNYNDVNNFGYASLGKELPESYFLNKKVKYINSKYIK